jgi:hypothetical protein
MKSVSRKIILANRYRCYTVVEKHTMQQVPKFGKYKSLMATTLPNIEIFSLREESELYEDNYICANQQALIQGVDPSPCA